MYIFNEYTKHIMSYYRAHMEIIDTIPMGFTGVAVQKVAPAFTNEVSEDVLFFGATVNFLNAGVLVRIKSTNPMYDWMADDNANPQDTPVNAIAGVFSQSLPVLPLIQPFFVKKQGRLQMNFTNDAALPITGGLWTWRGLRLTNPKQGDGWNYSIGF